MKLSDLFKEPEELAGPFEAQVMTAIEILGKDAYIVLRSSEKSSR